MAPSWLEKFIVRVDATPDQRITAGEKPATEVHYTVMAGTDRRRILGMRGDTKPRWQVQRQSIFGAWGSKCTMTRLNSATGTAVGADGKGLGEENIAVLDFHTIPRAYIEIALAGPTKSEEREIRLDVSNQKYDGGAQLGTLKRKPTGAKPYGSASWEMRTTETEDGQLVMSVSIDDGQVNGVIGIWREGLDAETVEQLVLVAVAQLEHWKFLTRSGKKSAVAAAGQATWLGAMAAA